MHMHISVHVGLLCLMTPFAVRLGLIRVEVTDPTAS